MTNEEIMRVIERVNDAELGDRHPHTELTPEQWREAAIALARFFGEPFLAARIAR